MDEGEGGGVVGDVREGCVGGGRGESVRVVLLLRFLKERNSDYEM
jgi:hypothetical protein